MENKKGPVIAIIVLVLISLASVGYIVYDKFILPQEEEREYTTIIDDQSININKIYKVGDILNTLDNAFKRNDTKYFGYLYKAKKLEVRDFDSNAAIYASMYNDLIRSNTEQNISNERIKNRYENIFGKTLKYTPNSLDLGESIKVTYDEENRAYKYTAAITNNDHKSEYLARNMKTTLKDDLVVITRKVFFVEYSGVNAIIYTDSSKGTKLGEVKLNNGEVNLKEVTGKYSSKLSTYDITFKLGSDDEYNFYKIERTK